MKREIVNWCPCHRCSFEECPDNCGHAIGYFNRLKAFEKRDALQAALQAKRKERQERFIVPCARCGKPHHSRFGGRYCSSRCRYTPVIKAEKPITPCKVCGKTISRQAAKYCSNECVKVDKRRDWKCVTCQGKTTPHRKYCSAACRSRQTLVKRKRTKPVRIPKIKTCSLCQTEYSGRGSRYCSSKCSSKVAKTKQRLKEKQRQQRRSKAWRESFSPERRQCPHCKKHFTTTIQTYSKVYCSHRCGRRFGASKRKKNNPHTQIKDRISNRLRELLKQRGLQKKSPIASYIGILPKELQAHLEKQFTGGMSWKTYGVHGWHVDHIIPCQKFDLTNEAHVHVCFNWRNLRPLWGAENIRRQHWLSVDDRLFMDEELYRMAKEVGVNM